MLGYLTDVTYTRRSPVTVLALFFATIFQGLLVFVNGEKKILYGFIIFVTGFLVSGSTSVVAGIACADIVRSYLSLFYI